MITMLKNHKPIECRGRHLLGILAFMLCLVLPLCADETDPPEAGSALREKTVEEQRHETILYGTENEIATLIQTIQNEESDYLDADLIRVVQNTRNRVILSGVFTYFGDREKPGLEERALQALEDWDIEATEAVNGAIDYLGKLKIASGLEPIKLLLSREERRFNNASFRALGRIGSGNAELADEIVAYLLDYYNTRNPSDDYQRELIVAMGETGSTAGIAFLIDLARNPEGRMPIRIASLEALSKIGDPAGKDAVIEGVSSQDPNVRSAAIAALGPFSGADVDSAILEAFRDSFWRSRVGAAQAAGRRKLAAAVPFLMYRAEHDDVAVVKDEAIKALGAIATRESIAELESLFRNPRNSDRVRILAAEMLIQEQPDAHAELVIAGLDEAKQRNQTTLYNGLLRVIGSAKTPAVQALAQRFLDSGGVTEKSYALDMAANNNFVSLRGQIEELLDPRNGSLARKAQSTLDRLQY